ncbi:MAG: hypothetical protein H6773_03985 [Pseudomonadales bacterium]|nr:hypothetical protein [Pseudomonadales bacterium]
MQIEAKPIPHEQAPTSPESEGTKLTPQLLVDIFLGKEDEEKLTPAFSKVVFGHSFADFDLDQLLTYYFALKLGIVAHNAPFIFTADVHELTTDGTSHYDDPTTLVIEGFGHAPDEKITDVKEKRRNGNIANGLTGEPAASELLRPPFQARLGKIDPEVKKQIRNLESWMIANETDDGELRGTVKNLHTLNLIKPIFYGLKQLYSENSPEAAMTLVVRLVELLEKIISGATEEQLKQEYAAEIQAGTNVETKQQTALKERLNNPATFKQITTLQNVTITYFDIRGLGVDKGAVALAKTKGKPDILILVDDQLDPSNTNTVLGIQYKIVVEQHTPFLEGENQDLLSVLHDRMQMAESQFGKGYNYSEVSSFGSHAAIVASPQSAGSEIRAISMWRSLQNFFDYPRYSLEGFKVKAAQVAAKLGTEQYSIVPVAPSESEYRFGNRAIAITLPTPEGLVTTTLSEEDLYYYEPLLTENTDENQRLLLARTTVSEPRAVVEAKKQQLHAWTEKYLDNQSPQRLLELLNSVNENSLISLPIAQKVAIVQAISEDPESIRHIWDKNDLTFSLIDARLPEEIMPYMEEYKLNRYKLKSLAHSIDTTLINNTISEVVRSKNQPLQQNLAEGLLRILQSETYKTTHSEEVYDSLLQSLLFLAAELRFTNASLAQQIVSAIETSYGEAMRSHWKQIDPSYRDLIAKNFPESSLIALIPDEQVETIAGLAGSKMQPFNTEVTLERMMESGNKTATILIEVTRPIKTKVMRSQFQTSSGTMAPLDDLDGYFSCGSFNLEQREHMKLVEAILPSLRTAIQEVLMTDDETKLRIIQGGFINRLTAQVQEYISDILFEVMEQRYPEDRPSELRKKVRHFKETRLLWANHNRQTDEYVDSQFLEPLPSETHIE